MRSPAFTEVSLIQNIHAKKIKVSCSVFSALLVAVIHGKIRMFVYRALEKINYIGGDFNGN